MDIASYLKERYCNGKVVQMIYNDLNKIKNFKNVLFVRTSTTGRWMDTMLDNNSEVNVTRIMYRTLDDSKLNPQYNIIDHSELETFLISLNKTFDFICIDPFHEYYESHYDLSKLPAFLTNEGILISHDCCPIAKQYSTPLYISGGWSGVTYACFVEFAYNNPDWFYAVIDNDTGIGIMSKQELAPLSQNFNREKQEKLIQMTLEMNDDTYTYYRSNAKELINLFSRTFKPKKTENPF